MARMTRVRVEALTTLRLFKTRETVEVETPALVATSSRLMVTARLSDTGFACEWNARRGAEQLHDLFQRIDMTKEVFEYRTFTRLKQLEYLIRTQQIDPQFFWTNEAGAPSA